MVLTGRHNFKNGHRASLGRDLEVSGWGGGNDEVPGNGFDITIGEGCWISSGAIISGAVKLGRGAFVGAGAVIIQGIEIGESCVIGAGAVVRHHVKANTTVVGNPAAQLE